MMKPGRAAVAALAVLATTAHAQMSAAEEGWQFEGWLWAIAGHCGGEKAMQAAMSSTEVISSSLTHGKGISKNDGLAIAKANYTEFTPALSQPGMKRGLCPAIAKDLQAVMSSRKTAGAMSDELARNLTNTSAVSKINFNGLADEMRKGQRALSVLFVNTASFLPKEGK